MSREIEIEFKNIVTQEEFKKIINEFNIKESDFKEQHNDYFDTDDFLLSKKSCALRIRVTSNQYELTLKQPAQDGILETTDNITKENVNNMIHNQEIPEGDVIRILRELHIPLREITYFGTLTTKRAEINYLGNLLVFDISSYLNKIDYEIEYEVKDRKSGESQFLSLMNRFNIPIRKTKNKIVRFYERKNFIQQGKE